VTPPRLDREREEPERQPTAPGIATPAAAGAAGRAAATAGEAVPLTPGAVGAVIAAYDRFSESRARQDSELLLLLLDREYPAGPDEEPAPADRFRSVLDREAEFEREFQRRQRERIRAALVRGNETADQAERLRRLRAAFDRERRLDAAHREAVVERGVNRQEQRLLRRLSPRGAYWKLSPFVREHTLDAVAPWCVVDGPELMASARRWFDGELVEVEVESGAQLSVSPNHPVLTTEGWVPARLLHEGHQLVRHLRAQSVPRPQQDVGHVPASVEQVHRSLLERFSLGRRVVPVRPEDFHGDGQDGEVEVVRPDRPLDGWIESPGDEQLAQGKLSRGSHRLARLLRQGRAAARLHAVAPVLAHATHLGTGLDEQPGRVEASGAVGAAPPALDAEAAQRCREGLAADSQIARELLGGLAGPVAADQVVRVRRLPYSGHVHDLQTAGGWYTADSLVVKNCLVMGEKWWPWSVLDVVRPALHFGCPCELYGLDEAISMGLMRSAADVPDPVDAVRRAKRLAREVPELRERWGDDALREAAAAMAGGGSVPADLSADLARVLPDGLRLSVPPFPPGAAVELRATGRRGTVLRTSHDPSGSVYVDVAVEEGTLVADAADLRHLPPG
jgi:hypothetical protein